MANIEITATQQVRVSISPVDKKGNPANLDGAPNWFSSNISVLSVEPEADGLSCVIKAVGPIGSESVTVRGDAKEGEEVQLIEGVIGVTVKPSSAVAIAITAGEITEQEDTPPAPTE